MVCCISHACVCLQFSSTHGSAAIGKHHLRRTIAHHAMLKAVRKCSLLGSKLAASRQPQRAACCAIPTAARSEFGWESSGVQYIL